MAKKDQWQYKCNLNFPIVLDASSQGDASGKYKQLLYDALVNGEISGNEVEVEQLRRSLK